MQPTGCGKVVRGCVPSAALGVMPSDHSDGLHICVCTSRVACTLSESPQQRGPIAEWLALCTPVCTCPCRATTGRTSLVPNPARDAANPPSHPSHGTYARSSKQNPRACWIEIRSMTEAACGVARAFGQGNSGESSSAEQKYTSRGGLINGRLRIGFGTLTPILTLPCNVIDGRDRSVGRQWASLPRSTSPLITTSRAQLGPHTASGDDVPR